MPSIAMALAMPTVQSQFALLAATYQAAHTAAVDPVPDGDVADVAEQHPTIGRLMVDYSASPTTVHPTSGWGQDRRTGSSSGTNSAAG